MKDIVKVSVRDLVEFILRSGDIVSDSSRLMSAETMLEGTKIHKYIQGLAGADYRSEVPLKIQIEIAEDLDLVVEGRADGVINEYRMVEEDNVIKTKDVYTIDEIKGTYQNVNEFKEAVMLHQAQACCYAYIVAKENQLSKINVQVTYVHMETKVIKRFNEEKTYEQLEKWFNDLVTEYGQWIKWQRDWNILRNQSIDIINFPFEYRKNQKKLISGVYRTIVQKKRLFVEAPTGTGKTISTIFPALKAMAEGRHQKVFYLTAKTIARTVAEDTCRLLNKEQLRLKTITLTAKEKLCCLDKMECHPKTCQRAKGHYDRVNDAVFEMIDQEDLINQEMIEVYAKKHSVCPFEFQLDVALFMDCIIGDYNYVFDPNVQLRRFFGEKRKDYLFLVDEAHNLIDRAREMYSAVLTKSSLEQLRKIVQTVSIKLFRAVEKCYNYMNDLEQDLKGAKEVESIGGLIIYLMRVTSEIEECLKGDVEKKKREAMIDFYFQAKRFLDTFDRMDKRYLSYVEKTPSDDLILKIFCLDPSKDLGACLAKGNSTIFFSATLTPIQYYKALLSDTAKEDYDLYISSPFDTKKRLLVIAKDVTSKYSRRGIEEYQKISSYIKKIIRSKNGNYLVFFPSYQLLQNVYDVFADELLKVGHGLDVIVQENDMTEEARERFLGKFKEKKSGTVVGFCVLGGIFSEGIDLKEDQLIGSIIIGTGLPQIGTEREFIKDYFNETNQQGFDFAYVYPGMNKVLQAGGRVIRTENDRGIIALLDERFNYGNYKRLFPQEWQDCQVTYLDQVEKIVDDFWENV